MAIGSTFENTTYAARRAKVKAHVQSTLPHLLAELETGSGPALSKAYDLARVPTAERNDLTDLLQTDPRLRKDVEAFTVSLMVHGA